jgi:hypothetical protein
MRAYVSSKRESAMGSCGNTAGYLRCDAAADVGLSAEVLQTTELLARAHRLLFED